MQVDVIPFNTQEVIDKIYTACRTCYLEGTPQEQYAKCDNIDNEKKWKLIKHVLNSQHHSVLEHMSFTFLISGISRACSHQLVRHRIGCSYSQQSQRYVSFKNNTLEFVTPSKIANNDEALDKYNTLMTQIVDTYKELQALGIPSEDARMVLPNACCTNLTVTMDLRALMHFCHERCCTCAQQEIRQMANLMAKAITSQIPELKPYLGPKCEMLGYCNEDEKRTCGRKPIKSRMKFENIYELQ